MSDEPTVLARSLIRATASAVAGTNHQFTKLNGVVSEAARMVGRWTPELEECLWDESRDWSEDSLAFYDECVQIIRAGVYVAGQGNYGGVYVHPDDPEDVEDYAPAHPKFLECRLTDRGRRVAEEPAE